MQTKQLHAQLESSMCTSVHLDLLDSKMHALHPHRVFHRELHRELCRQMHRTLVRLGTVLCHS